MATKPLASSIAAVNPGTASPKRLLPPHKGAPGRASSPNGAAVQALVNIATKRRVGQGRRLTEPKTAHLGKNLQAHVGNNDRNEQHPVKAP